MMCLDLCVSSELEAGMLSVCNWHFMTSAGMQDLGKEDKGFKGPRDSDTQAAHGSVCALTIT